MKKKMKKSYIAPETEVINTPSVYLCAGSPPPLPTSQTTVDPDYDGSDFAKPSEPRQWGSVWDSGWADSKGSLWED